MKIICRSQNPDVKLKISHSFKYKILCLLKPRPDLAYRHDRHCVSNLEFDSRVWGPPNEQKRKKGGKKGGKRRKREKGKKKFESSKIGPLFWGPPNDLYLTRWGPPKGLGPPKVNVSRP